MSEFTPAHFSSPTRLNERNGPHFLSFYDDSADIKRLEADIALRGNPSIPLCLPDSRSPNRLNRRFIQIPDIWTYFYGDKYSYDLFTTSSTLETSILYGTTFYTSLDKAKSQGNISLRYAAVEYGYSLFRDLSNMYLAAVDGDRQTVDAIHALQSCAKNNTRIAVIDSHGWNEYVRIIDTKRKHLFVTDEHGLDMNADRIARILSSQGTLLNKRYGAIYFSVCNDEDVDIEPTDLPIILHKNDYNPAQNRAYVRVIPARH